jgi:hypothetical protein
MVAVEVLGECQQVKCQQENESPHFSQRGVKPQAASNGLDDMRKIGFRYHLVA